MSQAIGIIYINITNLILISKLEISKLEKDQRMIEMRRLKNVIFFPSDIMIYA